MKNKIYLILILICKISFSQDYSSVIKIISDPEPTDFLDRFWGITDVGYIDIFIKNKELRYTTKINHYSENTTEAIPIKDNTIQIEGEWYQLVVFIKDYKEYKRNQVALYRDNKIFIANTYNVSTPYRYVSFLKLKKEELINLTPKELKLMRNEIYARHGYIFKKGGEMDRFYSSESWYTPTTTKITLNEVEKHNTKLIISIETQKNKVSKILTKAEKNTIFNKTVKSKFGINFNIRRAYKCLDQSGTYFLALAENSPKNSIKAIYLKQTQNGLLEQWKAIDNIIDTEEEIWFFTRYFDIKDIDNDGIIDPIIIYGTSTPEEGNDESRLKILMYYKNKKVAIRHQNCDLDDCRYTQIDKDFYSLPISIQKHVDRIMQLISENNHSTFNRYAIEN